MSIPDTPEALFEQLSEPSLRVLFPEFSKLTPWRQKLLRLLHIELTKGELSDASFIDTLAFIASIWLQFNRNAQSVNHQHIALEPEIDVDWVRAAEHYAAMDTYLIGILSAIRQIPGGMDSHIQHPSRYVMPRHWEDV